MRTLGCYNPMAMWFGPLLFRGAQDLSMPCLRSLSVSSISGRWQTSKISMGEGRNETGEMSFPGYKNRISLPDHDTRVPLPLVKSCIYFSRWTREEKAAS